VVLLDIMYDVETDVEDLSVELEQRMLKSLSGAITASMVNSHCGVRRLGESSRKLELEAIAAGPNAIPLENCTAKGTDSKSCMRYNGDLLLRYSDVGEVSTAFSVGRIVIVQVKDDMANGHYIDKMNDDLSGSGVSVSRVNYVGTNYFERLEEEEEEESEQNIASIQTSDFSTVDEGGLNLLGKGMVAFATLLLLLAICACASLVRTLARKAEARQEEQGQKREIATILSDEGRHMDDDESIVSADFHVPPPANSRIDVHRCISRDCNVCEKNLVPIRTSVSSVAPHKSSSVDNLSGEDCNERTEKKRSEAGSRPVQRMNPDGTIEDIIQMAPKRKPKKNVRFPVNNGTGRRRQVIDDTGSLREEVEL
jgi:hypothetical protein